MADHYIMTISKFLDPKNDVAFKHLFGTEKHMDILIHFINDMLGFEGQQCIQDVSFIKTSQDPDIAFRKQSLVDVLCTDEIGRQYIVEMQVAKTSGFEKRAQYYAAKAYASQLKVGEKYHQLKEIIFLAITDFVMFPDKPGYKSDHVIMDKTSHSHDLKDFYFSFLELPKFTKNIHELNNRVEKWAYFFRHAEATSEAELARIVESDRVIQQAYEALNRFSWTEIELNTYEAEEKRERDAQAILDQNALEAEAKGVAKGEAAMLVRLLKKKFGVIPEKYLQCIQKADADTLLTWGDEVISAETMNDIFK